MTARTRGMAIAGWFFALAIGAAVSSPLLAVLGLADINDAPVVVALTGPYVGGALFLLLHAAHIKPRITISLVLSLLAIVATLIAPHYGTGVGVTSTVVMAIYISVASLPLLVVGIHNLAWALHRATTATPR